MHDARQVAQMPMSVKIVPKRKRRPQPPANRLVVALAYDGLCTFEFGVAVEIFGLDRPEMGDAWYRFRVAAIEPGPLRAMGGIRVERRRRPVAARAGRHHHRSGLARRRRPVPARLIEALRRAHERGARLLSFCSGVFVLAATGPARRQARDHALALRERLAQRLSARSAWCPTCSMSTRAACSRRRAARPASI